MFSLFLGKIFGPEGVYGKNIGGREESEGEGRGLWGGGEEVREHDGLSGHRGGQ